MGATGELKALKSTFVWTISDFSKKCYTTGHVITSPIFPMAISANRVHEWYIALYPFGETKNVQDSISVFLILKPTLGKEIHEKCYFEFSIVDNSGDNANLHKCSAIVPFRLNQQSWGWKQFIERNKLFHKKATLLVNDTLKISCFIDVDPHEDVQVHGFTKSLAYEYQKDRSTNSLVQQYQSLFFSDEFSDLKIVIGDREIKTHKNILSSNSKVFSAMLKHNMKESNTDTITIVDVEYEVMREFLMFLYYRKQVSRKNSKPLLSVADKYDVHELKSMCEKILWDNLSIDDACEMLYVADLHSCTKLFSNVMNYIIANAKEVIKTKAFEELSSTHPFLLKEICCRLAENRTCTNI